MNSNSKIEKIMANSLNSISPIDGRYKKYTEVLSMYFSEMALMKYRIIVESEYLIALSDIKLLKKFSDKEKSLIRSLYNLSEKDAQIISDIEIKGYKNFKATDHDVKAIEYYIKYKLSKTSLVDISEWIHFALTSYDTNTLARGMMLSDVLTKIIVPEIEHIIKKIDNFAKKYSGLPMLARTHGQPASPTTFGKEFKVFSERLKKQLIKLKSQKISVKFSGASGNFNAHIVAFPKIDWIFFAKNFIKKLNTNRNIELELNLTATQIDPHDSEVEIFDNLRRINTILIDFNQDIWRYISDGWITQKFIKDAVGSSTMPHKINPIKFENSEGNLGLANALFEFFARKLPISRLQRDLSDSTVERNFGSAFGHCLVAYKNLLKGLAGITVDENIVKQDLDNHPEVITEAIQTILRREKVAMPYEKLKELTRGKRVTLVEIHKFINDLSVSDKIKKELLKITPENYTGLASKLASR